MFLLLDFVVALWKYEVWLVFETLVQLLKDFLVTHGGDVGIFVENGGEALGFGHSLVVLEQSHKHLRHAQMEHGLLVDDEG